MEMLAQERLVTGLEASGPISATKNSDMPASKVLSAQYTNA